MFFLLFVSVSAGAAEVCGSLKRIELVKKTEGPGTNKVLTLENGLSFKVGDASTYVSLVGANAVICGTLNSGNFELRSIESK